jgi:hypothetical protein
LWWKRWLRHGGRASQSGGQEGEKIEEIWQKKIEHGWFCLKFGFLFLHSQAMKSTLIYREWKRKCFYLMVSNRGPYFGWKRSQPLVQSRHHELSNLTVQGCLSWPIYTSVVASMVPISLNGQHGVVEKCHVIILIQALSNLVKVRGNKYTYKVAFQSYYFREN